MPQLHWPLQLWVALWILDIKLGLPLLSSKFCPQKGENWFRVAAICNWPFSEMWRASSDGFWNCVLRPSPCSFTGCKCVFSCLWLLNPAVLKGKKVVMLFCWRHTWACISFFCRQAHKISNYASRWLSQWVCHYWRMFPRSYNPQNAKRVNMEYHLLIINLDLLSIGNRCSFNLNNKCRVFRCENYNIVTHNVVHYAPCGFSFLF